MAGVKVLVETDAAKAAEALGTLGEQAPQRLRSAFADAAELTASLIVDTELSETMQGSDSRFGQADQKLARRTGTLAKSVTHAVEADSKSVRAAIGVVRESPASRYAAILETGGTITPVRAKYLTIPILEGLTPRGVSRYTSPRDVPEGHFLRTPEGNLFFGIDVATGQGKNRRVDFEPLFWLTPFVTIPAKHWLSRGASKHARAFADEVVTSLRQQTT